MKEHKRHRELIIQIPESELRHRYLDLQQPSSEIARAFKCSGVTVVARLNSYGIPSRGIKEAKNTAPCLARSREITRGNTYTRGHYRVVINENELRYRYLDLQQSTPDIAKEYGCSDVTIIKRLRLYNISVRNTKEAHNIKPYLNKFTNDIDQNELYDLYITKGLSLNDIAKRYKCSCNCVRNNLMRCSILIRSRAEGNNMPVKLSKLMDYSPTPETREKLRQANIIRYSSQKERDRTGRIMRQYHKAHPDFSAKQTEILVSCHNNPEMMRRMSESLKKIWQDPSRRAEVSKRSKEMWLDPKYKAKMVKKQKRWWERMDNPEVIQRRKKMMAGMNLRPNKPETIILNILDDLYPNEWKYTGDGQIIIGGLNPDFINVNGQKLIIECFGDYWHTQKLKPYRVNEGRVKVYASYGYKTLIIWERETKDLDALKHKISSFVRE